MKNIQRMVIALVMGLVLAGNLSAMRHGQYNGSGVSGRRIYPNLVWRPGQNVAPQAQTVVPQVHTVVQTAHNNVQNRHNINGRGFFKGCFQGLCGLGNGLGYIVSKADMLIILAELFCGATSYGYFDKAVNGDKARWLANAKLSSPQAVMLGVWRALWCLIGVVYGTGKLTGSNLVVFMGRLLSFGYLMFCLYSLNAQKE